VHEVIDLFIATAAAQSALAAKDPFSYGWAAYAWVIAWASAGGFVSFRQKMNRGEVRAFNLVEFIGEIVTSAFVGVLAFWVCEFSDVPKLLEAVIVSISGHMGTRAVFLFEQYMMKKFGVADDAKP
jgi:hypothetical protein